MNGKFTLPGVIYMVLVIAAQKVGTTIVMPGITIVRIGWQHMVKYQVPVAQNNIVGAKQQDINRLGIIQYMDQHRFRRAPLGCLASITLWRTVARAVVPLFVRVVSGIPPPSVGRCSGCRNRITIGNHSCGQFTVI